MEPFPRVTGAAAPLPGANIDTDVIMPKQFLKGIDRSGLRDGTFFDLRFEAPGKSRPDFVLNMPGWEDTRFLVVGPNFGCGSSREHAVWGLSQLGIRALIGTTYAGIFYDNCLRNGVLPVSLTLAEIGTLTAVAGDSGRNRLTLDLPAQTITIEGDDRVIHFDIDPLRKDALVRGLDAVGSTLAYADDIRRFEQAYHAANPWLA
jgi:3-isopropylmalate/(R)-2-methylmalate dehydratase small subunit